MIRFPELEVLGRFVANYIINNPSILFAKEEWHVTATKILKEFYDYSEIKEEPDWINDLVAEDRYLENHEEKIANVRTFMLYYINNTIAKMFVQIELLKL